MITRRNFIRISGLSVIAFGAGISAGSFVKNQDYYFSFHGFIPADETIIKKIVFLFRNKIKSNSPSNIVAGTEINKIIKNSDHLAKNESFSNNGNVRFVFNKVSIPSGSDIIISDSKNSIYSIDNFDSSVASLRKDIIGKKAEYYFSAEYVESHFFSSFMNRNKREIVIENERGLVDRISLNKNYKNILIEGPQGKTALKIENNFAKVHSSTCRHRICENLVADKPGDIIACAPNKTLIRVEMV